jgi:hypothetical protein
MLSESPGSSGGPEGAQSFNDVEWLSVPDFPHSLRHTCMSFASTCLSQQGL